MSARSKHQEALQLLDDLDLFVPPPGSPNTTNASAPPAATEGDAAEVLAFLDEMTQKTAEPTRATATLISRSSTPTIRKSIERVRLGGGTPTSMMASASSSSTSLPKNSMSGPAPEAEQDTSTAVSPSSSGGGWGWGSVWSTASAAIQQAREVVDEQVKHLPRNEQARKWGEGVMEYAKSAQLDKLGQDFKRVGLSTLTDILNVVAPPISEHEVVQVWLSHDMQGYDGIESLAYQALARIMEQVEGGDLVVNRGNDSRPKDSSSVRDMNSAEGYDAAVKLAAANVDEMIKKNATIHTSKPTPSSPTTYTHVYLRLQPFYASYTSGYPPEAESGAENARLQFLIYLSDPQHKLLHSTISQAVPRKWLGFWDEYDWVENLVAETLRVGIEVIGQEYIVARMGWTDKGHGQVDNESEGDPQSSLRRRKQESRDS